MSRAVLGLGVAGRTGLDMGSGTGVLAIVAAKCGAAHVDAVDIDDWADGNCRENVAMNGVADRVEPMLGDVGRIAGRRYDFILANINRNILVADMPGLRCGAGSGRRSGDERFPRSGHCGRHPSRCETGHGRPSRPKPARAG